MKSYRAFIAESVMEDPTIGTFLRAGVFGKEMNAYLRDNVIPTSGFNEGWFLRGVSLTIRSVGVGYMFDRLGGKYNALICTSGHTKKRKTKTNYPGNLLYHRGNLQGYPRFIHEISESADFSETEKSCVGILIRIKKDGFVNKPEFSHEDSSRNIKKLLDNTPPLIAQTDGRYVLSEFSKEIFSPEIDKILSELVKWEYRIDVIP